MDRYNTFSNNFFLKSSRLIFQQEAFKPNEAPVVPQSSEEAEEPETDRTSRKMERLGFENVKITNSPLGKEYEFSYRSEKGKMRIVNEDDNLIRFTLDGKNFLEADGRTLRQAIKTMRDKYDEQAENRKKLAMIQSIKNEGLVFNSNASLTDKNEWYMFYLNNGMEGGMRVKDETRNTITIACSMRNGKNYKSEARTIGEAISKIKDQIDIDLLQK